MRVALAPFVLVGALAWTSSASLAQSGQKAPASHTSSEDVTPSSSEDARARTASLDRIRERLAEPAPVQQSLQTQTQPTFRVQIEERSRFLEMIRALEFEATAETMPPPPNGWYGSEHQRIVRTVIGRERLIEPYAAFSGAEFVTLAIEGLIGKYLGERVWGSLTDTEQARAKADAREEAARAIRQYCVAQPGYGAGIRLCSDSIRP